jgi:Bardet-Biedl syndrome 9 protein
MYVKKHNLIDGVHFKESVPLQDLFSRIQEHYQLRQSLKESKLKLEKNTEQFRLVQKRMLTRFKEKNPTPLNNL